jgi:hypothetical protein
MDESCHTTPGVLGSAILGGMVGVEPKSADIVRSAFAKGQAAAQGQSIDSCKSLSLFKILEYYKMD